MIRRILKILNWTVGLTLLLGIAAWSVVIAINWRDRAPSDAAIRLANAYRDRPALADENNAFIYVMGFTVGPQESPLAMGSRRVAWMQRTPIDPRKDPLADRAEVRDTRHPAIREFIDACRPDSSRCDDAFAAADEVFERWIGSEAWLLDRYRTLIAHRGWREAVPLDVSAPLPAYALVMDGQRLFFLNARRLAQKGESAAVRSLLADDVRFWREVLDSSDILISKMIATVALNRHFEWGNLVLRELAPEKASLAVPAQWSVAISDSERSLSRCITGEWVFSSAFLRPPPSAHFWQDDEAQFGSDPTMIAKVLEWVSRPLYQPQDSINEYASHYSRVAEILDAPVLNYQMALDREAASVERRQRAASESRSLYNIIGTRLIADSSFGFGTYARRVNDIEGVRRAVLAAVRLRETNVQPGDVAAPLETAAFRNPYDALPFVWDSQMGAIVFVGLEPGERGRHRIRY